MAVSLLGIIGIQMFWLQKTIKEKEEQFEHLVNDALAKSAMRIERKQNAQFFSDKVLNNSSQQNNPSLHNFSNFWKQTDNLNINNTSNKNVVVKVDKESGAQTVTYGFDTTIINGNSRQRIKTYSTVTKTTPKNTDGNVENMRNMLANVMEQMVLEYSLHNVPIEQKIDFEGFESIIDYELKNNDIDIPFEYAVSDVFGNVKDSLRSINFNPENEVDIFNVQLFPTNIMQVPYKLHVFFPDKSHFIIKSLSLLLTISLVFTLTILLTFYYTLRTIFNQKKVSEIKNDFINNMTHEFKTPIATISLAADAISSPMVLNNKEQIKHFTTIIKEENKRMNRQVEGVLQMALLDKKDFNLRLITTNVNTLIEKAVKNIGIQVEQKGGKIEFTNNATDTLVSIDETHFTNIVNNLLDNANKYIGDNKPHIKVNTQQLNYYLYISIEDNGIGMDKETLDKIFDKFYRHTSGNIHTVKGFGLGLSYVKAIVASFNGTISVTSIKGEGSKFTIKLPVVT